MESLDFQTALGFTESFADQNVVVQGVPDIYPGGLFEECFELTGSGSYYASEEISEVDNLSAASSHVDEDDIVDIETVDDGVNIVQKMKEDANELIHVKNALSGSAARTTPINRSIIGKSSNVITVSRPEVLAIPDVPESIEEPGFPLLEELTPESVDEAIFSAQNETGAGSTPFSLLGIDGIEAEDLESLFVQFEDMAEYNPEKLNAVSAPVSPQSSAIQTNSSQPNLQWLTDNRQYNSAPCSPSNQAPAVTCHAGSSSLTLSFPVSSHATSLLSTPQQTAGVAVISGLIDHDYCSNPLMTTPTIVTKIDNSRVNGQGKKSTINTTARKNPTFRKVNKKHSDRTYRVHKNSNNPTSLLDKLPDYMTSLSSSSVDPLLSLPMEDLCQERVVDRDPSPLRDEDAQLLSKLPAYYNCFTKSTRYDKPNVSRAGSRDSSITSENSRCSRDKHKSRQARSTVRKNLPRGYRTPSTSSDSASSSQSESDSSRSSSRSRGKGRVSRKRSPSSDSSRSPSIEREQRRQAEHEQAMAERRVVYVGGISERFTPLDLRKRFGGFGDIEDATVHVRQRGDNYGFVTFYSTNDAYAAIEKGNDVHGAKYELCFGGRRMFCRTDYADLDGCTAVKEEWAPNIRRKLSPMEDFDALLKKSIKKLKKR